MVKYIDIDARDDGQRLDNCLMRELKGVPRQHIYKVIRSGEVRVNGSRARANTRLKGGDKVRIPPIRTRQEVPIRPSESLQRSLLTSVIYEDADILAINKPSGIAVHGGSSISSGVIEQLRLAQDNQRLELVHRLDRETSGCLLMAKKPSVLKQLQKEFRERRVKKIYELIVEGQWPKRAKVINAKLERFETHWGERRVRVSSRGQTAQTDFEIVHASENHTWLKARLHTGRTHQIRVHAASQGCPISGDDKYGSKSSQTELLLHASKLHVPWSGDALKLAAPVPARFQDSWDAYTSP